MKLRFEIDKIEMIKHVRRFVNYSFDFFPTCFIKSGVEGSNINSILRDV